LALFFITAATYGVMSLYGYTTKSDLGASGSFLMMGLIGIVIASLVNIFVGSSAFLRHLHHRGHRIRRPYRYDTQRNQGDVSGVRQR